MTNWPLLSLLIWVPILGGVAVLLAGDARPRLLGVELGHGVAAPIGLGAKRTTGAGRARARCQAGRSGLRSSTMKSGRIQAKSSLLEAMRS